jgi:hypothetical protein
MQPLCRKGNLYVTLLILTVCMVLWQTRTISISLHLTNTGDPDELFSWTPTTSSHDHLVHVIKYHHPSTVQPRKHGRLLIIAAAPKDERRIWTLWSELECFSATVDHVIVSGPIWSRNIVTKVLEEARASIPRFMSGVTTTATTRLESQFYVNDRYDVGLWCDALIQTTKDGTFNNFDEFGLLNDSVFALREYPAIFNALKDHNVSLSSLSYSYSAKNFRGGYGKEHFWVESVFRGMTPHGVEIFRNHSCLPANHSKFCREWPAKEQKGCIINHFEHDLALHFPPKDVFGFFESDAPPETTKIRPYKAKKTWASNFLYWQKLVNESAFPVAKENVKESIGHLESPLLKNCTRYLTVDRMRSWNLDFSVAEIAFKEVAFG